MDQIIAWSSPNMQMPVARPAAPPATATTP
jgi:hypothetical protein